MLLQHHNCLQVPIHSKTPTPSSLGTADLHRAWGVGLRAVPTPDGCQWCCPHKPSYGVSPRTQRQEAAEADSNPGKSLPAGNLHATCLLQPRGSFTTSGQRSSRPAEGSKDNSAQGRGPNPPGPAPPRGWPGPKQLTRPHRGPWGPRGPLELQAQVSPGCPGWSRVEAIWERPSKAPGGTTTATSSEVWGDHPLPELSRAQSSTHGARAGLSQSPHCSRPLCCRSTSVPPPHGVGGDEKYLERPPWWSSS